MNEVSCLSLVSKPEIESEWKRFFAERGLQLNFYPASGVESAQAAARQHSISFALSYLEDPLDAGTSLLASSPVIQFSFPPMITVLGRSINAEQREALRLQGVSYVVTHPIDSDRDTPVLDALLRSRQWLSGRLEQMSLADVLQMLGQKGHTALVTISLGGGADISAVSWETADRTSKESDTGWCGRVYLRGGMLVRAETPLRRGIEALAELLELPEGRFRIHEVALPPKEANLSGSIESNLMNAAVLVDHQSNPDAVPPPPTIKNPMPPEDAAPSPKPVAAKQAPAAESNSKPPAKADSKGKTLEQTLKGLSQLKGMARADNDANVLETTGELDADTAAAIAIMSRDPLEAMGSVLGMGSVKGWSVVSDGGSLFVHESAEGFVVAQGKSDDTPEVTLQKIGKALAELI